MSFRTYGGYAYSENGWRICNRDECVVSAIPNLLYMDTAPVRRGYAAKALCAWAHWYDRNVPGEIVSPVWGWSAENDVSNSNHLSGTALDINAPQYPWGARVMSESRKAVIRRGLELFEGIIFWGADWDRADEMHFQLNIGTADGDDASEWLREFCDRKIGPDGLIREGASPAPAPAPVKTAPGLTAETLSEAMGGQLPMARYEQLLHGFREALIQAGCNTADRAAMFMAQIGHESQGLYYMEEIASGAAYEGRQALGNTQPGDGVRFKGRGPIQITGRHNYTALSEWAYSNGYTPTPRYFVDNPDELASDQYGFLGAVWYWTVARDMNSYADAEDIYGATQAVNGGLNGIDDRIARWNKARSLGDKILPGEDIVMVRYVNAAGVEVDEATFMKYNDARLERVHTQLTGDKDGFPGWKQLGNRTLVDAIAAVGAKLGIEGFTDVKTTK